MVIMSLGRIKTGWLAAISFSLLLGAAHPSLAADESSADSNSAGTTLKGGVVEIQVTLNDLRDARLSISRVRKATANLYDEVTRQEVTMMSSPNMVGSTVIMTPRPSFSGRFLPAR